MNPCREPLPDGEQELREILNLLVIPIQGLEKVVDGTSPFIFDRVEAQRRIREACASRRNTRIWRLAACSAVTSILSAAAAWYAAVRHAAALSIVGWYLLTPPVSVPEKRLVFEAPLSQWDIDSSYDSARECNEGLLFGARNPGNSAPGYEFMNQRAGAAKCIASDDPRLKIK
jgi:hypothetical protein